MGLPDIFEEFFYNFQSLKRDIRRIIPAGVPL